MVLAVVLANCATSPTGGGRLALSRAKLERLTIELALLETPAGLASQAHRASGRTDGRKRKRARKMHSRDMATAVGWQPSQLGMPIIASQPASRAGGLRASRVAAGKNKEISQC